MFYLFLSRLYHYNDKVMEEVRERLSNAVPSVTLQQLHDQFYRLFDVAFCYQAKTRVTINGHTFAHLLAARQRMGPVWHWSAEDFESTYAVSTRCYKAGAPNVPLQKVRNFYLRKW